MIRGTADTVNAGVQIGGQAAAAIVAAKAAGAAGAAGAAASSAWVPLIGPAIAGVTLAIGLILNRKGPRQKVAATEIVNDLEKQLQANLAAYQSGARTKATQAAALANFDMAWDWLKSGEGCGNPALGEPGRRCITDRDRGGRWPWAEYYRDPIAADTPADDIPFLPGVALPALPDLGAAGAESLLIPAALVVAALVI
jgi:hypothetical protein